MSSTLFSLFLKMTLLIMSPLSLFSSVILLSPSDNNISSYISSEMGNFLFSYQFNYIGSSVISSVIKSSSVIYQDVNVSFLISLPVANGNIDNNDVSIVDIISENEKENNVIYSINNNTQNDNDNNTEIRKIYANCSISKGNLLYTSYEIENKPICNKRLKYLSFIFCLDKDIYVYNAIKSNKLITYNIVSRINLSSTVENFFIFNDNNITLISDDKLIMYEIITNKNNVDIYLRYLYNVTYNEESICDVSAINSDILISTENNGIIMIFKNDMTKRTNVDPSELIINGKRLIYKTIIVIDNKVIYALVEDFGIVIIKINSISNYVVSSSFNIIHHSKINCIKYYLHPFNGNKFIGIFLNNGNNTQYTEFYIEFLVNVPTSPKINRIYSSNSTVSMLEDDNDIDDAFHSSFYVKKENSILITRKAVLNSVSVNYHTIPYNNSYISDIKYPSPIIQCQIDTDGIYRFILSHTIETCGDSILYKDSYCNMTLTFDVDLSREKERELLIGITTGIIIASIVIVLVVLIISAVYSKGFTDYSKFRLMINEGLINDRDMIYRDEEEKRMLKSIVSDLRNSIDSTKTLRSSISSENDHKRVSSKSVDIITVDNLIERHKTKKTISGKKRKQIQRQHNTMSENQIMNEMNKVLTTNTITNSNIVTSTQNLHSNHN